MILRFRRSQTWRTPCLIRREEKANQILQDYIKAHPNDENAAHLFARLNEIPAPNGPRSANSNKAGNAAIDAGERYTEAAEPLPPNWLPADVDEKVPPVEAGTYCDAREVVEKAGAQLVNLVHDVDRFTATETLTHESVNKFGSCGAAGEAEDSNILVSIQNSPVGDP